MTKLSRLRSRLVGLKRRRWRRRLAIGYSALVVGVLAIMAAAMLLDWLLLMSLVQRLVALGILLAIVAWVFYRYTLPWLGRRENELDMALLVEREEHIDSDLVAALQFESPAAPTWGSVVLEQAVIDRVAELGRRLDLNRGVPRGPLARRMALLAASAVVWVVIAGLFPDYVRVFFNRLLLGSEHYPTRTVIEQLVVNHQQLDPRSPGRYAIKIPYGGSLELAATCVGRLPAAGEARLAAPPDTGKTIVDMQPDRQQRGLYRGQFTRLTESVQCQFYFGDAWTEPARLTVVPLPVAELQLEVVPPSYTKVEKSLAPPGLRQLSVIEGSQVVVRIASEKRLESAVLTVGQQHFDLHRQEGASGLRPDRWILDAQNTPLAAVVEPLQYTIQVTDVDGLALDQPIEGSIRIEPDQRPRVAGAIVTPYVLPSAKPTVYYRATDDFGLSRIVLVRQVVHADGRTAEDEVEIYKLASEHALAKDLDDRYPLDLGPLKLIKGDEVKITLRAVDFRGPREGQSSSSDPLVFHVTDQQGILAMMMQSDRQSAEQLKTMIQRQLGIGGSP